MTDAQRNTQAVACAGLVPRLLRRLIAGRQSDMGRKRLQAGLRCAERAYREVVQRHTVKAEKSPSRQSTTEAA